MSGSFAQSQCSTSSGLAQLATLIATVCIDNTIEY